MFESGENLKKKKATTIPLVKEILPCPHYDHFQMLNFVGLAEIFQYPRQFH